jgi:hypothetical protein
LNEKVAILSDVAIGSPYENNGVGAIYVYNGGYSVLKDQYTQRITGAYIMPFFNNSNDLYKQFQFESEHLL